MLKLAKRPGSPYWYARGTQHGRRLFESLGTCDKREADRLIAKLQHDIFEERARGPIPEIETFAGAALRYMEAGFERRFIAPLLRHFGETLIDQIDQQAIDRAATALYPMLARNAQSGRLHTRQNSLASRETFAARKRRREESAGSRMMKPHGSSKHARRIYGRS